MTEVKTMVMARLEVFSNRYNKLMLSVGEALKGAELTDDELRKIWRYMNTASFQAEREIVDVIVKSGLTSSDETLIPIVRTNYARQGL